MKKLELIKAPLHDLREVKKLQEYGVLLTNQIEDGKKMRALVYQGVKIDEGTLDDLRKTLAELFPHAARKKEVTKALNKMIFQKILGLRVENGNWIWKNARGTNLRWAKLSQETIATNIANILTKAKIKGKVFEARVGKKMLELSKRHGDELTDVSNEVKNIKKNVSNGDIDCATNQYILEAKSDLGSNSAIKKLYEQMQKYLPKNSKSVEKYMNPFNKTPVVVYGDIGTFSLKHPLLKELQEAGVVFIEGIENLNKLY